MCRGSLAESTRQLIGGADGRGLTVGVMGTGLDAIYPKENRKLAAHSRAWALSAVSLNPWHQNFPFRSGYQRAYDGRDGCRKPEPKQLSSPRG
jgi:hypothetical protein